MIIINFTSGLGNQMFQYFFGESLNIKYDDHSVKYLDSLLPPDQIKIWDIFELDINKINRKDLNCFNFLIKKNKLIFTNYIKFLIKMNLNKNSSIYSDNNYSNNIKFTKYNKDIYFFYGYWQNDSYFSENFFEIKKKFKFKKNLNLKLLVNNSSKYDHIIGIHIRGGDYLNRKNKKIFHHVDQEYYQSNIKQFKKKYEKSLFIIFTDDLNYANYLLPNLDVDYRYIHSITSNRFDDFQYLSLCDHFIIPNSSFSLWAAYFCQNKKKNIIMPDNWFKKQYTDDYKTKNFFKDV